jgi:hypothetical protein
VKEKSAAAAVRRGKDENWDKKFEGRKFGEWG